MPGQPALPETGQILLGILVLVAAVYDIRYRRIPNWLVLTGIIAGLVWNACDLPVWPGLKRSAAGLGTGFALYFPLYLLRARGAGDVKLLAAAGAIAGAGNCVWIFALTAVLGGLIALILLLFVGRLRKTLFNIGWILNDLMHFRAPYRSSQELDVGSEKGLRLPHAAMIAIGSTAFVMMARHLFSL